jgi:hypothetical protein
VSEFVTKNLQLASFILARGAEFSAVKGVPGRAEFVFLDSEEKLGWEAELLRADTPVPALQLFWAMRELRAQMDKAFGRRQ